MGIAHIFGLELLIFSADKGKYEAKNITLKENASLLVKNSKPDDAYMKIEDVIVSGNCQIDGSLAAKYKKLSA